MLDSDRILGTLLGGAIGDALGMPIDGLSHQNVRTYYRGIKGYRADEHRGDFASGQWTAHTQRAFAVAARLRSAEGFAHGSLRRPNPAPDSCGAATAAAPLGIAWASTDRGYETESADNEGLLADVRDLFGDAFEASALAAAFGQAVAVSVLLSHTPRTVRGRDFFDIVTEATAWAEAHLGEVPGSPAARLRLLADHLDDFPLDLQDRCEGTGDVADEAWPFAIAMVARNPELLEATVLPAVNVGGAASATGALTGALVGALHGANAFPEAWLDDLEDVDRLEDEAVRLAEALG